MLSVVEEAVAGVGRIKPGIILYSASIGYKCFMEAKVSTSSKEGKNKAFRNLWKSKVPKNIRAFRWRLFLNRMEIKDQLEKGGLMLWSNEEVYALCHCEKEDADHLFFNFPVSKSVWSQIGYWIGFKVSAYGPSWKFFIG